jgi:death on curing protein
MTRYLTVDELIYINEILPGNDQIHKILKGKQKVRDMGLLEAAAARPLQTVFGEDAYPTLPEKIAALVHSVARNHPFADGNKRTATVAAIFMLQVNGLRPVWDEKQALTHIIAVAEGQEDAADFAVWLPTKPSDDSSPEQDAEADMQTIGEIMTEHKWLLDELAKR